MQALASGGHDVAALVLYRDLRSLLHREMGGEPHPETTVLFEQIRAEAREKQETHSPGAELGADSPSGSGTALGAAGEA